jgi:hypothetical protein
MDAPDSPEALDTRASALMQQGLALMEIGDAAGALRWFDEALALRQQLPAAVPLYAYGLAACWLNRADALACIGSAEALGDALAAYDAGIAVTRTLPLGTDPRFPRRLAIALQNRALTLRARNSRDLGPVTSAFLEAIDVLQHGDAAAIPDRARLLAAVWVNVADTHAPYATDSSFALAHNGIARALALVAETEGTDEDAAAIGVTARHVRCGAVASRLASPDLPDAQRVALVHEATDTAEEALAIIAEWERKGVERFRGIAADLLRFGAQTYAVFQPQFVHEFVRDHTEPTPGLTEFLASDEMRAAIADVALLLDDGETSDAER